MRRPAPGGPPQLSPAAPYGAAVTTTDPAMLAADAPVFGRRPGSFDTRTFRSFAVEVEDDTHRWDEPFTAFADTDGGALVGLLNANGELQQAQAVVRFLATNLRNDDGVAMEWVPPVLPEPDPADPEEWLRAEVPPDSPEGTEGEPLYRWHDGTLIPRSELDRRWREFDELTEGSSRRRFGFISDAMDLRYRIEALSEIAQWLAPALTARPTVLPGRSGPGPSSTARGSGARRRAS